MIDLVKLRFLIRKRIGRQKDFAELIEESESVVSKVLKGKLKVSLEFADRTIKALNMNAKEIQEVFFTSNIKGGIKN